MYEGMLAFPSRLRILQEAIKPLGEKQFMGGWNVRRINRCLYTQEVFILPSKSNKSGKAKSGFTTTFVNFKLTGEAKVRFIAYVKQPTEEISADIVELMSHGMKFSFSENREGGFTMASVTCRDEGNINYDNCITSRSPDWWESLAMCVFKVHELGLEESWVDQAGDEDWG